MAANFDSTAADKMEQIGLLAAHGAWDYLHHDSKDIAIKAAEGVVIGAAIAAAPAWIGLAAGVVGVGLLGKELYDKGKTVLPAIDIVWHDTTDSATEQQAEAVISKELGSTIVDSAVMIGAGYGSNKLAGAIEESGALGNLLERFRSLNRSDSADGVDVEAETKVYGPATVEGKRLTPDRISEMAQDAQTSLRNLTRQYNQEFQEKVAAGLIRPLRPGGRMADTPVALSRSLDDLDPAVGVNFNGHGMVKGTWTDQLTSLDDILTNGPSRDRILYEMPLRGVEAYGGAFGAARPFDTGGFILTSAPTSSIAESGVKYVLVNDHFYDAIPELQAAYPHVTFIRADEIATRLAQILQDTPADVYEKALERAAVAARAAEGARNPAPAPVLPRRQPPLPVVAVPTPVDTSYLDFGDDW